MVLLCNNISTDKNIDFVPIPTCFYTKNTVTTAWPILLKLIWYDGLELKTPTYFVWYSIIQGYKAAYKIGRKLSSPARHSVQEIQGFKIVVFKSISEH